jgi:DNA polymerase elongation subunit (family B)
LEEENENEKEKEVVEESENEEDGEIGYVESNEKGILPVIIENLIKQRKLAKKKMSEAKGIDKQIWNIR